jgi:hypothetical protein
MLKNRQAVVLTKNVLVSLMLKISYGVVLRKKRVDSLDMET